MNKSLSLGQSSRDTPFVARELELSDLARRLELVQENEAGEIVLIAGEPGVGKTRLTVELAGIAKQRGWQVLFGHAYDSEGMPAYLPFIEALRDYVADCPLEVLSKHVEQSGPEIALLVPQIGSRLDSLPPVRASSAEEERYRLFESVTMFLRDMAQTAGLLLCLDDLHWADKSSLLLLQHLARRLGGVSILNLGTYRTVNLDRSHPLATLLADLSREHLYERILLDSLTLGETGRLIEAMGNAAPDEAVVEAIYRETNGNAFFVEEVVRHLVAEGHDLQQPATAVTEWGIPEGVRQVLGQRLSRLTPATNRLLQFAAVSGTELDLPVLEATGIEAAALMEAVEEAINAGLLKDDHGLRFSHPLVRETVYNGLSLPRKQRVHSQIAEAIERAHAQDIGLHLPALAAHYRAGGTATDQDKAIDFSMRAGKAARAVYAWEEAAAHYEGALKLSGGRNDSWRCDLLLVMGEALVGAGVRDRVINEVAPTVLRLAQTLKDDKRAFAACRLVIDVSAGVPREWLDTAERYIGDDPRARIALNNPKSSRRLHQGRYEEARSLCLEALSLARGLGDPVALLSIASHTVIIGILSAGEEQLLFEELLKLPLGGIPTRDKANMGINVVMTHLQLGERAKAETQIQEVAKLATETHHEMAVRASAGSDALFAMLDGRLPKVIEETAKAGLWTFPHAWRGRVAGWLGDSATLEEEVVWSDILGRHSGAIFKAFFLAHLGRQDEAREVLAGLSDVPWREPVPSIALMSLLLEAASLSGDHRYAGLLREVMPKDNRYLVKPNAVLVPRHLGNAAALLGDFDRARAHYHEAIEFCERLTYRPELALTRFDLAKLLLAHYPREGSEAHRHLDLALAEFNAMGMKPYVDRAQRLQEGQSLPSTITASHPDGLTDREVEVLRLLVQGKSNREIAEELILSVRTVERHISNVYLKTDTHGRARATAYTIAHGLT